MALILNSSLIIFLTVSLLFSLPRANAASSQFSISVLNVTEALHQAHQILSFKPKTFQPFSSSSSSFSLQLHPRDSLFKAHHKDYRSLVLTRLARDSARVTHIRSKLSHVSKTELRPQGQSPPVTSGVLYGSGEYFTRIGVGQPSQTFYVGLDTGNDLSWVQCRPCLDCYKQFDPIFDPSMSSSYVPVTCESDQCHQLNNSSCFNNQCQYDIVYGDGSFTKGSLVTETMSLGNIGTVNQIAMGCGHDNHGSFVAAAGILGLGGGPLSFTSQIKATSFSYCLVDLDTDKTSTLEFNSPLPRHSVTTRLLKNPNSNTLYYVEITGMSVGGIPLPIPESVFEMDASGRGGIIVDSGTVITRLLNPAYEALRDAFVALTKHLPRAKGFTPLETCYDLPSPPRVIPSVSFEMRGGSWRLAEEACLIRVDTNGTLCFAFAPSNYPLSIIGNFQQQGSRVSFDLANSVVGFSHP
ncbi:protein ASPARTIC PROTEASE IN GUARD CELL 1-like [Abrus precatorius]|uniref:Protein ASPARTIC PROTEASE IN GUARD CELL 1-like n=1 Tax=Abrus precatorius TaxID=3816 RepID=A0A8B8KDQ5_ABRPR|nr:protein ASPARTIC PROTEASE IN GUARD CELL 1-like [Abrus precatorius]